MIILGVQIHKTEGHSIQVPLSAGQDIPLSWEINWEYKLFFGVGAGQGARLQSTHARTAALWEPNSTTIFVPHSFDGYRGVGPSWRGALFDIGERKFPFVSFRYLVTSESGFLILVCS